LGFVTMVHLGEDGQVVALDGGLQASQRRVHRKRTRPAHDSPTEGAVPAGVGSLMARTSFLC
jgi:hypothetical protein